jgi:hypothetical protein
MKKLIAACLILGCLFVALASCKDKKEPEPSSTSYVFACYGIEITVGSEYSTVSGTLSAKNPTVSTKSSCLGGVDGEDVTYVFAGFHIQTFRHSGGEEIRWIVLDDDSHTTKEGIAIGATKDAVTAAYGAPKSETATLLTYQSGASELRFTLRDGHVTGISYCVAQTN